MKKRILALMSMVIMSTALFTGCGDDEAKKMVTDNGGVNQHGNPNEKQPTPIKDLTNINAMIKEYEESDIDQYPKRGFDTEVYITPEIVHNDNNFAVAVMGLEYTDTGVNVNFAVQNDNDEAVRLVLFHSEVNKYMIYGWSGTENIEANSTQQVSVHFEYEDLLRHGITAIANMKFELDYTSSVAWGTDNIELKTNIADSYDYSKNTYLEAVKDGSVAKILDMDIKYVGEDVLIDKNNIKVTSQVFAVDEDDNHYVYLEFVNENDMRATGYIKSLSLNGVNIGEDFLESITINPHSKEIVEVIVDAAMDYEYWNIFGINELKNIEIEVELHGDSYSDVMLDYDKIKFEISSETDEPDFSGKELYNKNDISFVSKGIYHSKGRQSDSEYYWLFVVTNNCGEQIRLDDGDCCYMVNGVDIMKYTYCELIDDGESAIIGVRIWESELSTRGIESIDELETIQVSFVIRKGAEDIDTAIIKEEIEEIHK